MTKNELIALQDATLLETRRLREFIDSLDEEDPADVSDRVKLRALRVLAGKDNK